MRRRALTVLAGMILMTGAALAGDAEVFDFNREVATADHEREAISRFMVRAPEYTVSAVIVNKEIPLHQHDDGSHVLYIVSGHGTATLDGQPVSLTPGALVHIPRGVKHSITATGGRITLVDFVGHAVDPDRVEHHE
jgi:quercetin dioxygenase-like cupin family protein